MFRNVPIRRKLAVILVAPLLTLTVISLVGVVVNLGQGNRAAQERQSAALASDATALVHELQRERNASQAFVASGRRAGGDQVAQQRQTVDAAHSRLAQAMEQAQSGGEVGDGVAARLGTLRDELARLAEQRRSIDESRQPPGARRPPAPADARPNPDTGEEAAPPPAIQNVNDALNQYDTTIQGLLGLVGQVGADAENEPLSRAVAASRALSQYKEALAQEWGLVTELSTGNDDLSGPGRERLIALVTEKDLWLAEFRRTATAAQQETFDETAGAGRLRQHEDQALQGQPVSLGGEVLTQWVTDGEAQFNQLQTLESELIGEVVAAASGADSAATQDTLLYGALLILVVLTAIALTLLARSLIGPLVRLRDAANNVADRELPEEVTRLRHSEGIPPKPEIRPIPVRAGDEVGEVTEAFNAVHRVALEAATEQATMRRGISEMFLNLARRNQALIDRQLELIDELERSESDPDALEELFRLDHLATRMRRTAEDLIVLSGAKPARRWSQPVPLADAVRAAIAEVEDYTRVELLPVEDLGITGQAVADIVHLLAELIENATAFSPPGTKVHVAGQTVSNGYVVEIEDRGIGMSDSELVEANERLGNPLSTDLSVSQRLGLFVVARLAGRYGVKVQLRHSWYDGITALVFLPEGLIVDSRALQLESTGQINGNGFQAILPELGGSMSAIATKTDLPPGHPENIENPFAGETGLPTDEPPGHTGELPRIGGGPRTGEFSRLTGEFPRFTDFPARPQDTPDFPTRPQDAPPSTEEVPDSPADLPAATGEFPQTTGDSASTAGDLPAISAEFPRTTGDFPQVTGDFPQVTGEFPVARTDQQRPPGRGDRLPIFEATRSDWFDPGPDNYSPLRRRPQHPPQPQDGPQAGGPAADAPAARGAPPGQQPSPPAGRPADAPPRPPTLPPRQPGTLPRRQPGSGLPMRNPGDALPGMGGIGGTRPPGGRPPTPPPPPRQTSTGLPMRRPGAARPPGSPPPAGDDGGAVPAPLAQPSGPQMGAPAGGPGPTRGRNGPSPRTGAGLPRRVPNANRPAAATALPAADDTSTAGADQQAARAGRSPDDIRSMLSRYRTGFERGRHEATSASERRPEDRQPPVAERNRDGAAAPRSDDDAVE